MVSTLTAMSYDDDIDALLAWSTGDLADKIARNDPDEDAFVLRVLAARIAERADASRDPLHLIKDFSRVTESLAAAVRVVIPKHVGDELDNPESATAYGSVLTDLDGAAAGLHDLHNWF